jgi:hypothetical protein
MRPFVRHNDLAGLEYTGEAGPMSGAPVVSVWRTDAGTSYAMGLGHVVAHDAAYYLPPLGFFPGQHQLHL